MSVIHLPAVYFSLDIDECTISTHNCDGNATCTNYAGTFNCACNHGYEGNGTECAGMEYINYL